MHSCCSGLWNGKITYAGRTDSKVSATNMIGSLRINSRLENPNLSYKLSEEDSKEFKYDLMINTYLPQDIRIIGWAPVEQDFSARFSCIQRKYRYYFCKEDYNISNMRKLCREILEMRNFYYFSKHSDENAKYDRRVDVCEIIEEEDVAYLDIRAKSFLHNMVRKIFWTLDKVGRGEVFDIRNVGIADPSNLIFCGAVYAQELEFLCNKRKNDSETERKLIEYKIEKLRNEEILKFIGSEGNNNFKKPP